MEVIGQAAVKSKQPGDTQDYHVLALSAGDLSPDDFASVYKAFSVGTMSFTASSTGEKAPWVTIGPFAQSAQRHVAVIRQDWTDRQDNYGRPVAAQCCLCLPERALTECAPSYNNLFANVPNQRFFLGPDKEPLEIPITTLQPLAAEVGDILRAINTVGFEFCSYVAVMLLISPVAILKGHELSVDDRLSFFDAVTCLLPYGARADLAVSTWMNSTSIEKIRLGFSTDALPNQKRIIWRKPAPKELKANEVAYQYYQHLDRLWNDPESVKEQIITELANKRTPLTFNNVPLFLAALREIHRERAVYESIVQNRGKKEEVRELLKTESKQHLSQEQLEKLLVFLLQEPELADIESLRANWDASLWVPACQSVKGLRAPVFQADVLWALCQLAAEKGWLDKLLEALLECDGAVSTFPAVEMSYWAMQQFPHNKERVRYLLLRNVKLAYEFLFTAGAAAKTEAELEGILSWLAEDNNARAINFRLIRTALGLSTQTADAKMIEALADLDESYVQRLVTMAATRAQRVGNNANIEHLRSAVSAWLVQHLQALEAATLEWRAHLRLMQQCAPAPPALGAQLDLLILALDKDLAEPLTVNRYLADSAADTRRYGEEFTRVLARVQGDTQEIVRGLITQLNGSGSESPEALSNDMCLTGLLTPVVTANHVKNLLIAHVGNSVREQPALITHESFTQEIKEPLLKWGREKQVFEVLYSAFSGAILMDAPVNEVVGLYLQMSSLAAAQIEERVATDFSESSYFTDIDKIECFLKVLTEALTEATKSPDEAWRQTKALEKHLLRINSEPMRQYRETHAAHLIETLEETRETLTLLFEVLETEQLQTIKTLLDDMRNRMPSQRFLRVIRRK